MEKMWKNKAMIAQMMLPVILVFGLVLPAPMLITFFLSFTKYDFITELKYVGLANYIRLFTQDTVFQRAILQTMQYTLFCVLFQVPLAYLLGIELSKSKRFYKFIRTTYFAPVLLSGTAISLMFYFVYHDRFGVVNNIIRALGFSGFHWAWLAEPSTAMLAITIRVAWQNVGYHMMLFVAGMSTIPLEVLDAARIDGASSWQIITKVITPLMKPIIRVSLVFIVTGSLKAFDTIYVMTGGGPAHATEVMGSWMYAQAFQGTKFGLGAAIAMVICVLCIVSSRLITRLFRIDDGI